MTDKQKRFVAGIAQGKTQTQAAIDAGYPAKSARVVGSQLLTNPNIQGALDKLNAKTDAIVELSAAKIKADLYATHTEARAEKQYGAAVNALGKILDKCAPDLAETTMVIEVAEV